MSKLYTVRSGRRFTTEVELEDSELNGVEGVSTSCDCLKAEVDSNTKILYLSFMRQLPIGIISMRKKVIVTMKYLGGEQVKKTFKFKVDS